MAFSSGFFNSKDHDRMYNAEQVSMLFDGLIYDGVIAAVGNTFQVLATTGTVVNVDTGRAWFNHTWSYNDAELPITCGDSEVLQNRYDAIVLEVNTDPSVRANEIKVVHGTPATSPAKPTMTDSEYVHQYPLAYIYRKAESTSIIQADIENAVGTSACPLASAVLESMSADQWYAQWNSQINTWYSTITNDTTVDLADFKESWNTWFASIKGTLSEDAATNLYNQLSSISVELTADGWSDEAPYSQTVTVAGMESTFNYEPMYVDPVGVQEIDEANQEALACVSYMITGDGSVTAYCYEDKPTTTITVHAQRRIDG